MKVWWIPANDKSTQDYFGHAIILSDTHMTWHDTSQLTTLPHPTSPHNQPHYFISPRNQPHDIKTGHITTTERQKARSEQKMVWASRWSVALRTFYRQFVSLVYNSFLLKLPPPARPGTTCSMIDFVGLIISCLGWRKTCKWSGSGETKQHTSSAK